MDAGLYITFFESGEPFEKELPPVGPLDHVVIRQRQLLADRHASAQAPELGTDVVKWLEAELEFQRATGGEPGGPRRRELRVVAPDGVFLRFAVFGDATEGDLVPELGPFAVVVVGARVVDADGGTLATRAPGEPALWDLTAAAGNEAAGLRKPDIAFRTTSTGYHAQIAALPPIAADAEPLPLVPPPSPPEPEPLLGEPEPRTPEIDAPPSSYTPASDEAEASTRDDRAPIERVGPQRADDSLRARIRGDDRPRFDANEADDAVATRTTRYRSQGDGAVVVPATGTPGGMELGPALWRMRFAIIGVLLLLIGVYGFTVIRGGGSGQAAIQYVTTGQRSSSERWDYVASGVQRSTSTGTARARGVYYVVRLAVTAKADGEALSPNDFTLVDAGGVEHDAEPLASVAYQSGGNPQSQLIWPQSFAAGKTVTIPVVFDVEASLGRGNLLKIADVPNVRVRLD